VTRDLPTPAQQIARLTRRVDDLEARALGRIGRVGSGWLTYVPALTAATTDPNLGDTGIATGQYVRIGSTVIATFWVDFGGTGVSAGSGAYSIALPLRAATTVAANPRLGVADLLDDSTGTRRVAACFAQSTPTALRLAVDGETSLLGHAVPWTWAAGDHIRGALAYRALDGAPPLS
jgi:hypothetical protein